jgi:hypothetical protein
MLQVYYVQARDFSERSRYGVMAVAFPDGKARCLTRTGRWVFRNMHPFADKLEAARALVAAMEKEAKEKSGRGKRDK